MLDAASNGQRRGVLRCLFVGKIAGIERRAWSARRRSPTGDCAVVKHRNGIARISGFATRLGAPPRRAHDTAAGAAQPHGALLIDELFWNTVEKARLPRRQQLAVAPTLLGVSDVQLFLGARDTDIEEPPLLLEHVRIVEGA